jgi:hypothetical protein
MNAADFADIAGDAAGGTVVATNESELSIEA